MKQCPYGRGILGGLVVGIYSWLVGGLVWMKLFGATAHAHTHLWRPMGDSSSLKLMAAAYLVFGLLYSLSYAKLSGGLAGCIPSRCKRGVAFGFVAWLAFGLGFGLVWYTVYAVSLEMLYAQLVYKALMLIGGGFLLGLIYGDTLGACEGAMACDAPITKAVAPKKKAAPKKKKK